MNSVSWLIYLSDVAATAQVFGTIGAIGCVVSGVLSLAIGGITRADARLTDDKAEAIERGKRTQKLVYPFIAAAAVFSVFVTILPSKSTVMMIAASEVGETVLASKDVQAIGGEAGALASDSLKLLRKYVTEQLGENPAAAK